MADKPFIKPVEDSVSRVNDEVAVGEDLDFQRRWWRFENAAWIVFTFLIILDLAGVFGRGPVAKAERRTSDKSLDLIYERIERTGTPSIMSINFGQTALLDGQVRLFVSSNLVKPLGTQRVIPAPKDSAIGDNGITYTFSATKPPASVDFALQPSGPGIYDFTVGVVGKEPIRAKIWVVP